MPIFIRKILFSTITIIIFCCFYKEIYSQPQAQFTANQTSGCGILVVNFINQSTGATSYLWNFGDPASGGNNTSTLTNPSHIYTQPGSYTVTLIAISPQGRDTLVKTNYINVYPKPIAAFRADTTRGCAPLNVQFTDISSTFGGATISSWLWDFGDASVSSNLQNPLHTYQTAGTFNVKLTITDNRGCTDDTTIQAYIKVDSKPSPSFTISNNYSCQAPFQVNFTNTTPNQSGLSFFWDFGDGSTSTQVSPSHTYTSQGTFSIKLVATSPNGCKDSIIRSNIITLQPFKNDFTATPTSGCETVTVTFSDTSTTSVAWFWNFSNGTSNAENPTQTFNTVGSYTITLISWNAQGCSDTVVKTNYIKVHPNPTVSFYASDTIGCQRPFVTQFFSTPTGSGYTRTWNFGGGSGNTSATNPTVTYNNYGSFTVSLTVKDNATGCSTTVTKPGYIDVSRPTANFTATPLMGCQPQLVTFNNTSTFPHFPRQSYIWDFGDGSPLDTNWAPTHVYTDTGCFNVRLIVKNTIGCADTLVKQKYICVGDTNVTADFHADPTEGCHPLKVNFYDDSSPYANAWYWYFGDTPGIGSQQENPQHTYEQLDYFTVTLIAAHYGCRDTMRKTNYIFVKAPKPQFSANKTVFCERDTPYTVNFIDQSDRADTWLWDFGDGNFSNLKNPTHTYTAPGLYTVKLKTWNTPNNCVDSIVKQQYIKISDINPDFTQNSVTSCVFQSIQFNDQTWCNTSIVSWKWDFGDPASGANNTSTLKNPTHQYMKDTIVTVTLIVKDQLNCFDTVKKTSALFVHSLPGPRFVADTLVGCRPFLVNFIDQSFPRDSAVLTNWLWDFGDGHTSTERNPTHVYQNRGVYTVKLKVTNNFGCDSTYVRTHYIKVAQPYPNFTMPPTVCHYNTVNFTNLSNNFNGNMNGLSFHWNFGDSSPDSTSTNVNPSHKYNVDTTTFFNVSLYVVDTLGCDSMIIKPLKISHPIAMFYSDTTDIQCPPIQVNFFDSSTADVVAWEWNFGDPYSSSNTSNFENTGHTYEYSGTYDIRLVVTNSDGCKDTAYVPDFIVVHGPFGNFDYFPKEGCAPLRVTFVANAINTAHYTWYFGPGDYLYTTSPVVEYTYYEGNTYYPALVLTDSLEGPDDPDTCQVPLIGTTAIRILSGKAKFVVDTNFSCSPAVFNFTDSSTSAPIGITSWHWDFGDNSTSNEQNPSHFYSSPGDYSVILTISIDSCTYRDTLYNYIHISNLGGNFSFTPKAKCSPPLAVEFNSNTQGTDNYIWFFGDNNTHEGDSTISHTYLNPGSYLPYLVIVDTLYHNDTTFTQSDTIIITNIAVCYDTLYATDSIRIFWIDPAFTVDTNLACNTSQIFNFTDQSISYYGIPNSWHWNFGDGTTSTQQNPSHSYSQPGVYDIYFTISIDSCHYHDTIRNYIYISGLNGSYTFAPAGKCSPPLTTQFQATLNEADHIIWHFGDSTIAEGITNVSHTYTNDGSYPTWIVIFDTLTFNGDTLVCHQQINSSQNINVYWAQPDFSVDTTYSCNTNHPFHFTDLTQSKFPINSWLWNFGNSYTSNLQNPTYQYPQPGNYDVTLTVTIDSCQYTITKPALINIFIPSQISFAISDTVNCEPLTFDIHPIINNPTLPITHVAWNFGDNTPIDTNFSTTHTYYHTNNYNISLTVTYANNCTVTYNEKHLMTVYKNPVANFGYHADAYYTDKIIYFYDSSYCVGDTILLWHWDFGDNETADMIQNPTHSYDYVGEYEVLLVVVTQHECSDTAKKIIKIIHRVEIPNAFTPDGDGINDVFMKDVDLTIVNRWGQVLYQGRDGWDGTYKGEKVSIGTYYYIIKLDEVKGEEKVLTGPVTVVKN